MEEVTDEAEERYNCQEILQHKVVDDDSIVLPVQVKKAYKSYGRREHITVLSGLDMKVECGQIYGLLGPSGAGKTTLISCILGLIKLDAGDILLYGVAPGDPRCGIPGCNVGYMPQELALYGAFTIYETLHFFGRVFGLKVVYIVKRISFLLELLDLPNGSRYVKNLSGGQARRVSFAIAMLHEPSLMILDEPTVGVDPLLRERIWKHLLKLSEGMSTIVITTHYAEEARYAHRVGFLRGGRMVVEDSPDALIIEFSVTTLDDVFLKLARMEGDLDKDVKPGPAENASTWSVKELEVKTSSGFSNKEQSCLFQCLSRNHVLALIWKNSIVNVRNIGFILFALGLPAVQVTLFCVAIGGDPKYVVFTIVNNDASEHQCQRSPWKYYSCWYISQLKELHDRVVFKDFF